MNLKPNTQHTILAGIDFTLSDEKVIAFASLFQAIYDPIHLIFYHVTAPETLGSLVTDIETEVKQRVEDYFGNTPAKDFQVLVESGDKEELWIKKSKDENIDLLVLGRKAHIKKPLLTHKLINTSGCSLCLVPEHSRTAIKQTVVAVDFSEQSKKGVDAALAIAKDTGAEIHCLNVYTVPIGYYSMGKDYDQYAEIMRKNAVKDAEVFQQKINAVVPLNFDFVLDDDHNPSDKLNKFARQKNADLVCVSSGGMSPFAAVFFDTTAEKIVDFSNDIPLLIVKDKNKNRGFWEVIRIQ